MKIFRSSVSFPILGLLSFAVLSGCGKKQDRKEERPLERTADAAAAGAEEGPRFRSGSRFSESEEVAVTAEDSITRATARALRIAENHPEQSVAWAESIESKEEREGVLRELAWYFSSARSDLAFNLANSLSPGAERWKVTAHLVGEWAVKEPREALDWAKEISDPDGRDEALAAWVVATGESSPVTAADLAVVEIRPGLTQNRAVISVLQRWMRKDHSAASGWVDEFPEGPLKNDAIRELQAAAK